MSSPCRFVLLRAPLGALASLRSLSSACLVLLRVDSPGSLSTVALCKADSEQAREELLRISLGSPEPFAEELTEQQFVSTWANMASIARTDSTHSKLLEEPSLAGLKLPNLEEVTKQAAQEEAAEALLRYFELLRLSKPAELRAAVEPLLSACACELAFAY